MNAQDDEDDTAESGFLKVYDESKVVKEEAEGNTKLDVVKTQHDELEVKLEEDAPSQPKVEELSSVTFDEKPKDAEHSAPKSVLVPKFDWETAERVDAKYQFINQGELIFLNCNFKGYNKD